MPLLYPFVIFLLLLIFATLVRGPERTDGDLTTIRHQDLAEHVVPLGIDGGEPALPGLEHPETVAMPARGVRHREARRDRLAALAYIQGFGLQFETTARTADRRIFRQHGNS